MQGGKIRLCKNARQHFKHFPEKFWNIEKLWPAIWKQKIKTGTKNHNSALIKATPVNTTRSSLNGKDSKWQIYMTIHISMSQHKIVSAQVQVVNSSKAIMIWLKTGPEQLTRKFWEPFKLNDSQRNQTDQKFMQTSATPPWLRGGTCKRHRGRLGRTCSQKQVTLFKTGRWMLQTPVISRNVQVSLSNGNVQNHLKNNNETKEKSSRQLIKINDVEHKRSIH